MQLRGRSWDGEKFSLLGCIPMQPFTVMKSVRRYFLSGVLVLLGGAAGGLFAALDTASQRPGGAAQYSSFLKAVRGSLEAVHAVDRLTFGARPGDFEQFRLLGRKRWIEQQLHPEQIPENPQLEARLRLLNSLWTSPISLQQQFVGAMGAQRTITEDLTEAKLLRAVYSNRQLFELLCDFWYNHFNVFLNKGADRFYVPSYDENVIRPHVLGKFYDLLLATAQSPAMLFYLDNWQSVGPSSVAARRGRKHGLNENYGRELLELHTLGVNGGYTQEDVINVARCFTGWTLSSPREGGGFIYKDVWHDKGQKVVLGHVINAGGGMDDGLRVLAILARQPATARFISWKLAQRFVADDPAPSLVARMTATFLRTDGDLREVMHSMLLSPEFWSEGAFRAKVKMPLEVIASALRATAADVVSARALFNELNKLGEPLYRKVEPSGYSSANAEWVSSAGLLERMNLAAALAMNRIPGIHLDTAAWQPDSSDPIRFATEILGQPPSPETTAVLENAVDANLLKPASLPPRDNTPMLLGLLIGSPDFQRH
jgi:hypothetical protein